MHIQSTATTRKGQRFAGTCLLLGLGLVLVLVLVALVEEHQPARVSALSEVAVSGEADVRSKGVSDGLAVYRRNGAGVERLWNGVSVRAGDLIQIGYRAGEDPYGAIFSVDGAGGVSLHFPDTPHHSTALDPVGLRYLEHAFELDAAPRFERILFVTAERPIDVGALLRLGPRVAAGGGSALPVGLTLRDELSLKKGRRW